LVTIFHLFRKSLSWGRNQGLNYRVRGFKESSLNPYNPANLSGSI
jgi:hypothetical protein